jgi:hypothetical protein
MTTCNNKWDSTSDKVYIYKHSFLENYICWITMYKVIAYIKIMKWKCYVYIHFFYRNELKQPMNIPFHIYVSNNEYILAFFWNYVRSKGYQNHSIFISLFLYMLSLYTLLFSRYNSPKKSVCICTLCRL